MWENRFSDPLPVSSMALNHCEELPPGAEGMWTECSLFNIALSVPLQYHVALPVLAECKSKYLRLDGMDMPQQTEDWHRTLQGTRTQIRDT